MSYMDSWFCLKQETLKHILWKSLAKHLAIYSLSVCSYPLILLQHTAFTNDLGSTVVFSSWTSYRSNHTDQDNHEHCGAYVWCTESNPMAISDRVVVYTVHIKWYVLFVCVLTGYCRSQLQRRPSKNQDVSVTSQRIQCHFFNFCLYFTFVLSSKVNINTEAQLGGGCTNRSSGSRCKQHNSPDS